MSLNFYYLLLTNIIKLIILILLIQGEGESVILWI